MALALSQAIFEGGPSPDVDDDGNVRILSYGTAGFRARAALLDAVMFRVGVLAALRSASTGKVTGVVITASHNPEEDNGSKIVDADGGGTVIIGKDTRESSAHLAALVAKGVRVGGATVEDMGLVTTPQVHWSVMRRNAGLPSGTPDYFQFLARAFRDLTDSPAHPAASLVVDCANGVGARALAGLVDAFKAVGADRLELRPVNVGGAGSGGRLNHECGAEHVQKARMLPTGIAASSQGIRYASVDGDADRLVYFYVRESDGAVELLDGDKIMALLATYIAQLLSTIKLPLSLGIIQTAYANGASTAYLTQQLATAGAACRAEVCCTATGVKHLHHRALDFDVGAYFEANGHGTVIFNDKALSLIQEAASRPDAPKAAKELEALTRIINPAIGDAFSDLLAVEAVLGLRGWSLQDWSKIYTDLPSRMTKVSVPDRTKIKTTEDETRVVQPAGLQEAVDALVSKVDKGRSFVRPSGTEDCVRVYAEAATQELADRLAAEVGDVVKRLL